MVIDYMKKGAVMSSNFWRYEARNAPNGQLNNKLSEEKAWRYFRHLTKGIDYRKTFLS